MSYERVIDESPIDDTVRASPYGGDVLAARGIWQDDMDRAINRISPTPSAWSRVMDPFKPMVADIEPVESDLTRIIVKVLALAALDEIATTVNEMGGNFRLDSTGMMEWNNKVSDHQFSNIMLNACLGLVQHYASIEYAATQHTTAVVGEMDRNYWVCSCGDRSEIGFPEPHIASNEGLRHIMLVAQEIRTLNGE